MSKKSLKNYWIRQLIIILGILFFNSANADVKNFVDIPITALIHIQNIAPGPPIEIATATPAIFPIPIVADNAVLKAWK